MPPPTKNQKTDDVESPIVFPCPGQKPNVRLTVFNQEFHVQSLLRKLNSAFFRKFLDSPDKAVADPAAPSPTSIRPEDSRVDLGSTDTFKYEWVTKVDEGGQNWSLLANTMNESLFYSGDVSSGSCYNEIAAHVTRVTSKALVESAKDFVRKRKWTRGLDAEMFWDIGVSLTNTKPDSPGEVLCPRWFRALLDSEKLAFCYGNEIDELLESHLMLDRGQAVAGKDDHESDFLCAQIEEEDLPWVIKQKDW